MSRPTTTQEFAWLVAEALDDGDLGHEEFIEFCSARHSEEPEVVVEHWQKAVEMFGRGNTDWYKG
jgi:hypothetical protein